MKIAAVCATYNRPAYLRRLLTCFLRQWHKDCELLILDDAGQYDNQSGDRWQLISVPRRFRTLGEKRNAAVSLTSPDTQGLAVWDDDDYYFPWALEACAEALARGVFCQPHHVMEQDPKTGILVRSESFHRKWPGYFAYHGAWAYNRDMFERLGGYKMGPNGCEDQEFQKRAVQAGVVSVDIDLLKYKPFYVYNREGQRISEMGDLDSAYGRIGEQPVEWIGKLEPLPDDEMPGWNEGHVPTETRLRAW